MIVGFVGTKVVLDYLDVDTNEHISGDAQPWELYRVTPREKGR
jgi:hypothetical protein